jgi:hypothetical protein
MPKQQKQKQSRKNYLNPYFGPSGSRGGIQIRLPNTLPTFSRNSLNIPTGSRPGSTPSKPSSSEPSAWSQFDKYGGRALLIGTGAHLAYKGGKYIQQRFISSQGRNFAPGQEPRVPNRVADDVPDIEVMSDEQIEMANLGANRLIAPQPEEVAPNAPEGMQPFNIDSSNLIIYACTFSLLISCNTAGLSISTYNPISSKAHLLAQSLKCSLINAVSVAPICVS